MNTITRNPNGPLDLLPGFAGQPHGLLALLAPHAGAQSMLGLAARLAQRGPLRVLDGGNRFNVYTVARYLRSLEGGNFQAALGRIHVARAFTCYQMVTLLAEASVQPTATLVFDLLDTFYDESVSLIERRRLLAVCLQRLRVLAGATEVVISVRPPPPPHADPTGLLQAVQSAADRVLFQEEVLPALPPRLFE